MTFRVVVPSYIQEEIRHFHPLIKQHIRSALDEISREPHGGKPLKDDLHGFYSYRVDRHRIVYKIVESRIEVHVLGIGHRSVIYGLLGLQVKTVN